MNTQEQPTSGATTYAPRSIIIATLAAIVVAALVFVAAILPAEYGSDPLGTGALLGLNALANGENPLEEQVEGYRQDTVEFILEPFQSVEYKYHLDFDAPMVFDWQSTGVVYYDMHAEPAGIGEAGVQSFKQDNAIAQTGSFHAPFAGIHGWFWENRSGREVTVTLNAAGYFYASTVFRDGGDYERTINAVNAP
ncbi:hypothetical protein N8339_02825 [Gammaproteobacteria bacterium]|nr:hypothetical protein [Gammaproteobacteria bacterium]